MYNINNLIKSISIRGYFTLLALIVTISVYAQELTLKGVIVDETDTPLIGATIQAKGTSTGAITDFDGKFTLKAKKGATISISYIGYKTQELKFNGQRSINIKMVPDNQALDEVVVVGYGAMKRSDLTGSVASVAAKDIEGFQTSSVAGALGGQIAGVQITSTDGTPGAGFNINIRGVGSLTGDSSPLYIVDGFQVDDIDYLSNSDIESIEVLKDASSSAIYGARAANGVVMITTKSGKSGKPQISYNGSASYRKISKTLDVLSPYEFVKLQGEVNNDLLSSYISDKEFDDAGKPIRYHSLEDYVGVKGVDWQEETFNPTWSQDHNFSLRGGSNDTQYNAAFSRYVENGIFNNSGFDKTTAKFRIDQKINKNISFNATINYALTNRKGVGTTADSGRFNMLAQILSARPTGGNKLTDEELLHSAIDPEMLETGESLAQVNPVMQTQSVTNNKRGEMWSGNASVSWQIIQGLTFKSAGTYNTTNSRTDIFYKNGSKEAYRNGEQPYGRTTMQRDVRWTNFNTLTWKQKVKKHNYDVMLGHEVSYKSTEYLLGEAMGFPFDQMENDNMGLGATPSKVESTYYDKTLLSFYARANYNYDNRYLATVSVRTDGSSKFASGNRWGTFPSFSLGWRIDQEEFFKNWDQNVWNGVKLRGGWGQIGNQNIPSYAYADIVSTYETWVYGFNSGQNILKAYASTSKGNKNIKWETVEQGNVGVDLGFFKNSLTLSVDAYIKTTRDMLMQNPLPNMAGYPTTPWVNAGSVENRGLEFLIGYQGKTGDFRYAVSANFTFQKNKLVETGTNDPIWGSVSKNEIGEEFGRFYGYVYDGIFQSEEEVRAHVGADGKTLLQPLARPGDARFKNISGDNRLDSDDRTYIGNPNPDVIYGGNIELGYKGFDFALYFQGVAGNDIWTGTKALLRQTSMTNLLAETYTDAWRKAGDKTDVFGISRKDDNDNYRTSSWYVQDGSFLKIKSVQLGYTFPKKWIEATRVASSLRLYVSAENLFTITKFKYMDPEVPNGSALNMGMENLGYPNPRTFTVGVNVQF